jgi:hypothetical protein
MPRRIAPLVLLALSTCTDGGQRQPRRDPPALPPQPEHPQPAGQPDPPPRVDPPETPPPQRPDDPPTSQPPGPEPQLGCFSLRREIAQPAAHSFGELGDVDHDGRLDILTVGSMPSKVEVWLGASNGLYVSSQTFEICDGIASIKLVDLDADTRLDLVVSDHDLGTVTVRRGRGDGTFDDPQPALKVRKYVGKAIPGDFTGDGQVDLAMPVWSSLMLLKNAKGTLKPGLAVLRTGQAPEGGLAVDLDRDGRLDLAVPSNDDHRLDVFMSSGPGTFGKVKSYPCGTGGLHAAAADLTGDGHLDLAMANGHSADVCVFRGDGRGGFEHHATLEVGHSPWTVRLVDITGDERLDVVTAAWHPPGTKPAAFFSGDGVLRIHAGDGKGNFVHHSDAGVGMSPSELWIADTHGDGHLDAITVNGNGRSITVLTGAACELRLPPPGPQYDRFPPLQ